MRQIELALHTERGLDRVHIFSDAMRRVFEQVRMFHTKRDVPVLIEGDSGTGKELVARYLHYGDTTVAGPFVALNCTAMSTELFQSELFGYEGGAFTGAKATGSPGKLELAQGGTLFLDEIGEMPLEFQVRLLRVLETREYYRVGGLKKLRTDARFIFATNCSLVEAVAAKRFRNDLYHRLHVGHIVIPPLRERRTEILPFAEAFLEEFARKHGVQIQGFSADAQQYLYSHPWEGNVRELRNTIERAVILAEGPVLTAAALSGIRYNPTPLAPTTTWELPEEGFALEKHEIDIVRRALQKHRGNKTQTARYLGLSLKALRSRLQKL
jgi:transcriptional regulator with PAS, ATPase and Fis domain